MVKRSSRGAPRGARRRSTGAGRVYAKSQRKSGVRGGGRSSNRGPQQLRITVVTEPSAGMAARPTLDNPFMRPAPKPTPPKKAQF